MSLRTRLSARSARVFSVTPGVCALEFILTRLFYKFSLPPMSHALATVEVGGKPVPAMEKDGKFFRLPKDLMTLLAEGAALDRLSPGEEVKPARVLTPLQYPGKVLCAGAKDSAHLKEMGVPDLRKEAQRLFFFFKPPRHACVGPGRTVKYPGDSKMFDWEVELAAVIGKKSRRLTMANAL